MTWSGKPVPNIKQDKCFYPQCFVKIKYFEDILVSFTVYHLDNIHDLHDYGDPAAGEHVDCYDGKYISTGQWDTERMVQTGNTAGIYLTLFVTKASIIVFVGRYIYSSIFSCVHIVWN